MTPAELVICAQAYAENRRQAADLQHRNDYNLAVMIRAAVWAKRMPGFQDLFPEPEHGNEPMTDEKMFETVRALNALWGGEEA